MPTAGSLNYRDYLVNTPTARAQIDLVNDICTNYSLNHDIYQSGNLDSWTVPHLVSSTDLDDFAHRLFKIIKEHTPIDISEDEFMELIMNDR